LIGEPNSFKVDDTTNACTQGLWIYNRAVQIESEPGKPVNVVLVDTEGLSDTNKNQTNDTRIFMLAILLSSHTIFNCTGVIDSDMITQLRLVTELTNRFRLSNAQKHDPDNVEPSEYAKYFPVLSILIRDF